MSRSCTALKAFWPTLPARQPARRPHVPGRLQLAGLGVLAAAVLLAGCATDKALRTANAPNLYTIAHKDMVEGDTANAAKTYEALTSRFPFTSQARQARLDLIYVYYRKGDKDAAVDAANEFLREEPTNPRDDYAWYMKGMVYFERQPIALERWLGVDMARKPPLDILKSIAAFNTVVTQYPHSAYAHDARVRLIYLRNRLAQYDVYVASYYVRRGAYLAAAQRASEVLSQYEGAPAEQQALQIMMDCYKRLGLMDLAADVQRMYAFNFQQGSTRDVDVEGKPGTTASTRGPSRHWWTPWH